MTPEECRLLIPSYLRGELSGAESEALERNLATDSDLRVEVAELSALWADMAELSQAHPSSALRAGFYRALGRIEQGRAPRGQAEPHAPWWSRLFGATWNVPVAMQAVGALVVFAAGLLLGRMEFGTDRSEMTRMGSQVQNLRELVALSMLDRQSASSRLEGVAYSSRLERPNEEVVSALVRALNHDSNVNVRLSSIDALERFAHDQAVSKALVDALDNQDSPLVQIALIDSLVNTRNQGATGEFRKLMSAAQVNPAVRQRAQWGLQKLTYQ